jgi:hypothetical protein
MARNRIRDELHARDAPDGFPCGTERGIAGLLTAGALLFSHEPAGPLGFLDGRGECGAGTKGVSNVWHQMEQFRLGGLQQARLLPQ